ncbi:unnamed protein product [Cylicocyclus nassatus]|uniref:Uncharacterized protein n=1 Tax=Cylicocyclus nassatus TaxID=53992 RepID=A0AA36GV24_CYLNA|nr:unnamed protein product [Cylicocyclus nassatus]
MLRSHMEKCDAARAQLDEWYEHRTKVEAELSKLAWQFDKWGLDSRMESLALQSVESRSASVGPVVGARDGARMADERALGEAAQVKSKNQAVEEESITRWMDTVVGLLQRDRILTNNLLNSIIALQTSAMILSFKIRCGVFDEEGLDSWMGITASLRDITKCPAHRTKIPVISDIIRALAFGLPWNLAEIIKGIKDLAVESPHSRCEAATEFHLFVACAKLQRQDVRSFLMEYLAG